jgi:DNA-binding MarR family transcriptional regulator
VRGDDADESLSDVFWQVARALRHTGRVTLEPFDITPGHSRALGVLMHHGEMRLSELSDHLRIAPRSTTEVVDALEERGLVERKADPSDRRATLVALTDAGTAAGTSIQAARRAEAERFFGGLSEPQRRTLLGILRTLRDDPSSSS